MAFSGRFETRRYELEEDFDDDGGSDLDYDSDYSECDPSYTILEETNAKLSRLSIKQKSKTSRVVDLDLIAERDTDDVAPNVSTPDESEDKDIEEVQKIIKVSPGKLDKLKVEQCKAYLRKNGLRLTGNKDTLVKRINEHLEILNGGEKKYPESSFTVNCKGDACTGDVVMFEQKVYEMYNIASRSSIGPSCGIRIVAGRIVKESYGASKQQHTFTIEVLWSKGEKPLPPLHPLLIKGRNLYRMKTLRQIWKDEGERQKVLMEKHSRGSLARSNREVRVLEKEKRKMLQKNGILRKESFNDNSSQSNLTSAATALAGSTTSLFVDLRKVAVQHQQQNYKQQQRCHYYAQGRCSYGEDCKFFHEMTKTSDQLGEVINYLEMERILRKESFNDNSSQSNLTSAATALAGSTTSLFVDLRKVAVQHQQQNYKQQQRCRYYAQGRCSYGENCKFFHEMTKTSDQLGEERWRNMHCENVHFR